MAEVSEKAGDGPQPQKQPNGLAALLGKVWDEMAPAAAMGATELASALYRQDGFVLYGQHPGKDGEQPNDAPTESTKDRPVTGLAALKAVPLGPPKGNDGDDRGDSDER